MNQLRWLAVSCMSFCNASAVLRCSCTAGEGGLHFQSSALRVTVFGDVMVRDEGRGDCCGCHRYW
jgi:hypothetical protein